MRSRWRCRSGTSSGTGGTDRWRTLCRWGSGVVGFLLLGVGAAVGLGATVRPHAREQLQRGERLYVFWCASCHGRGGEGGQQVPALAGPSRRYPCRFPDARGLYEWVSRRMPPEDVLRPQEYWDILAFLLRRNGELPRGLVLGPRTAPKVPLRPCPQRR